MRVEKEAEREVKVRKNKLTEGFGKKKEEKKEAKAALQRQKSDILSDHEFERMKEERERIEAGHPELREHQSRDQQGGGSTYPDVEDDEADPNYARIQNFRDREMGPVPQQLSQAPPYNAIQHSHAHAAAPQNPSAFPGHGNHANDPGAVPDDDHIDRLYAKVNKPRAAGSTSPPAPAAVNDSLDRIQQLRREYQQARREGIVPPYEELDQRRRGHENDAHRMPGRGADPRLAPRYEEVERQYASLPRRGPLDPAEYPMQPWAGHYPGPPQAPQGYPQPMSYPNPNSQPAPSYSGYPPPGQPYPRPGDPRGVDPAYYPHPSAQQRGPMRQDVPPSPTPPLRGLRYDTMMRGTGGGGYRHLVDPGPDQYSYTGEVGRQTAAAAPNQPKTEECHDCSCVDQSRPGMINMNRMLITLDCAAPLLPLL
ncbi:unnamed protein product [Pleuronectes platessa]|uniref:Uncharacterized protein n=1 Tax=Pleuronectes platessa TaxID=8262 RepID=A0A9N7UIC5_PLEPL|nr:unnamed protein product [Pleuronectes platessa]